jgi:hypothetical protein
MAPFFNMELIQLFDNFILVGKLLLYLINGVGLELALWIFIADRKKRVNQLFSLFTICLLLWLDFDFAGALAPFLFSGGNTAWISLFSARVVFALLCPFFLCLYLLPFYYFQGKPNFLMDRLFAAVWLALFVLSFTPLVIGDIAQDPNNPFLYKLQPGGAFAVYAAAAFFTFCFSLFGIWKKFNKLAPPEKKKNVLFLAGLAVFGAFNIVFNVILPALRSNEIKSTLIFCDFLIIIMVGFGAYQILRERLAGFKVILIEIFVGLMGASLAVIPFLIDIAWLQVVLISLFLLFCIFGYLLVKGVVNEYREKIKLEESVRLRTEELEEAKKNLEEMNSILEVRVRARTGELQKLNLTLEQKVNERTKDLEEKIEDLEKYRRITVGRELKMIELKKEIESARAKIAQSEARR